MSDVSDVDLLRSYSRQGSEAAFAGLVERHVNLVYSAALRQVGNATQAEEIAQAVFIILARKAASLRRDTVLDAWLYETTRLTSLSFLRGERRRQFREQEAYMQSTLQEFTDAPAWNQLAPLLDEGMARLGKKDREAIVLRFFKEKNLRDVASAMNTTEAAAQSRVHRAVEKLRKFFLRRGIVLSGVAITGAISAHSVEAAPAGLAKSISVAAMAKGAAASASTLTLITGALKIMAWTKMKSAIVVVGVVLLAAGTTAVTVTKAKEKERKIEKLWRVNRDLPSVQIDALPAVVKVLPTKFLSGWVNLNSGANGDKFVGGNARVGDIAAYAYGFPRGRIRFVGEEPTNRFDFVATLPQGSREALQHELKVKLGLIGHRETENMDVLLLNVKRANAAGLKPPANLDENFGSWSPGAFHFPNVAIATGPPRFDGLVNYLERYFKLPVIDQTGITQHFSVDVRWTEQKGHPNHEGLEEALRDQLGLELVPTNMPIEMLVLEKEN